MKDLKRIFECSKKQHFFRIIMISLIVAVFYNLYFYIAVTDISLGLYIEILSNIAIKEPLSFIEIIFNYFYLAFILMFPIAFFYITLIPICYFIYLSIKENKNEK